jgi:hypothetical protein
MIRAWRSEENIEVLNVAGPRASEVSGIYETARTILDDLLRELIESGGGEGGS